MYRHVVVGTDGSESARLAVGRAAELAAVLGAKVTVVTIYEKPGGLSASSSVAAAAGAGAPPEDPEWRVAEAQARADSGRRQAMDAGVVDVEVRVEAGSPADTLVKVAQDVGADLLVVGSKGMQSAARFLMGSVPNRVSHHAPCDIIIVRTAD